MDKAEKVFEKRALSREFAYKLLSSTKGKSPTSSGPRRTKALAMKILAKEQHVPSKTGRQPLMSTSFIESSGMLDVDAYMKKIRVRKNY